MTRVRCGLPPPAVIALWAATSLLPRESLAGTTGKIAGRVIDSAQKPVPWVQVLVPAQRLSVNTNAEGDYAILNVPPGAYEVVFRHVSYKQLTVRDVLVTADQTARCDAALVEATVATLEEIVVTAKRPPVDLKITSSQTTVTKEEIESLPVQQLDDLVNLQAGVVEGHFRGGRLGEVQYQVDGISVNNAFDNKSAFTLDRSLLQEVQVISGTFDAEYGQAMSGVVNAVLRQGTDKFVWSAEGYTGGFAYSEAERSTENSFDPVGIWSLQGTASGPLPIPNTVILGSLRRASTDDYFLGVRRFAPTDSSDFENKVFVGSGDGEEVPLAYNREWSGAGKLTNTSLEKSKFDYQFLFDFAEGRQKDFAYRLNPDGLKTQELIAICHGPDWTKTFNKTSYLELNLRQNYTKFTDFAYEDVSDRRYDEAGPAVGDDEYELGAYVQGVDFGRFYQRTNMWLVKSTYVNQVNTRHLLKGGLEMNFPDVSFGSPGFLVFTSEGGSETLNRFYDQPPDFPAIQHYRPFIGAAYAQDAMEWEDFNVRAGFRLDTFDARSTVPSDLANPANTIQGAPESVPVATSAKTAVSPRLGVSYPIEDWASLHFAYGHFRQFPPIGQIFTNANYDVLANLQAGGVDYGVLGNPDVSPEKTVQYEFGYKQVLNENMGLDVTTFYKDIRDLLGVEFIDTYNGAQYARLTNVDLGDVIGVTASFDMRKIGRASLSMDYTWQQALGNSSDPRETATRASAGEDPQPRIVPFVWDQRHTFNLTAAIDLPNAYSASAILRAASGQPYTPVLDSGFNSGLETNSGRKPVGFVLDLRAEKNFGNRWGPEVAVFARAFNLFDARYYNGFVFNSTGSPYYSRFPEPDRVTLADPNRFYPPRRLEFGVRFGGGES